MEATRGRQISWHQIPWSGELTVSHLTRVLETELRFFAGTVHALNCWAVSWQFLFVYRGAI